MARVIEMIIRLRNDAVMVFDANGEQIPEYQGKYEDVRGKILRDAPPDAVFTRWFSKADRPQIVSKENW